MPFSESRPHHAVDLEQVKRKMEDTLSRERPDITAFTDLYGEEAIARDTAYVDEMEARFAERDSTDPEMKEIQTLAAVFEGLMTHQTTEGTWLGHDVATIPTTRYDDIKNGVDSIAEFREGPRSASYLALGIDVTISAHPEKKFQRIKEEIDRGELAKVKYFSSEHMSMRGELSRIPRVVIGVHRETIEELARLWQDGSQKDLDMHPVQFQIIEEMQFQMVMLMKYAEAKGQKKIAEAYQKMLDLVTDILQDKKNSGLRDTGRRDPVAHSLQKIAREVFRVA